MLEDSIDCGWITHNTDVYTFCGVNYCKLGDSWYYSRPSQLGGYHKVSDCVINIVKSHLHLKATGVDCVLHIQIDRWE